jgi:hypothetical protein
MKTQTSLCSFNGDLHFIEKVNGIKYLYASLDKHPHVHAVVGKKVPFLQQGSVPCLWA